MVLRKRGRLVPKKKKKSEDGLLQTIAIEFLKEKN